MIDKKGALVGLLWGGTFSNVSTSAIITDIHTVIASIKEMAGLEIQIGIEVNGLALRIKGALYPTVKQTWSPDDTFDVST